MLIQNSFYPHGNNWRFFNYREIVTLSLNPEKDAEPYLLYAQWSPRGHSLIIVHEYDIYYKTIPFNSAVYRITNNGIPGKIHNGIPDWLYEGK